MTTTKQIVQVAKDFFSEASSLILKNYLAPIIAIPILGNVVSKLIDFFIAKISDGLELLGYFKYVDFRTTEQGKTYFDSKVKGYQVELSGTLEEKQKAEDEIKKTFEAFAKFNS